MKGKVRKDELVGWVIIAGMWFLYACLVIFSNAFNIPIGTVGGILLLLGFIALATIFGLLSFIIIVNMLE